LGNKSCESQAKNTAALTEPVNRVAVSKQDTNKAPMTLVRPFACQLYLPTHRFPIGA
jgi:hypothetical protein